MHICFRQAVSIQKLAKQKNRDTQKSPYSSHPHLLERIHHYSEDKGLCLLLSSILKTLV